MRFGVEVCSFFAFVTSATPILNYSLTKDYLLVVSSYSASALESVLNEIESIMDSCRSDILSLRLI